MIDMSIAMKIVLGIGAVFLVAGSILVIVAALFQPKEYDGDGKSSKPDCWDEAVEDV